MRILITGAGGMLGQAVTRVLSENLSDDVRPLPRSELDIVDSDAVRRALQQSRPEVVINCAAYTRVDDAERDKDLAYRTNGLAATHLARCCQEIGARYVYPSTDYVFDGTTRTPYAPDAESHPIGVYGRSKRAGELGAREAGDYLVVRTSWLYGPGGRNFVRTIANAARAKKPLRVVADQRGSPTWTFDLAHVIAGLIEHAAPTGTYHATNSGETTWFDLAVEICLRLGLSPDVEPCTTEEYGAPAPRPAYSVLDCSATEELIGRIRPWETALRVALQTDGF
jgi:dTDP-4-dehydrorhamnose reductase